MPDLQIFDGKMTKKLIEDLKEAGLEVEINIDLSRNVYVALRHGEREIPESQAPNAAILRLVVHGGRCSREQFSALKSGWLNRRMAQFVRLLDRAGGLEMMRNEPIIVEAPFFDAAIVNFRDPPMALCNALKAAAAPSADAFMALPSQIRSAMGIYRRESSQRFTRIGAPLDPAPEAIV